jgi:hypothetical protein
MSDLLWERRFGAYELRAIAQLRPNSTLSWETALGNRQTSNTRLYRDIKYEINLGIEGTRMAFKPNYGRDRAERGRAARARSEEKQRKKDERTALRKAERAAAEPPPDEKQDLVNGGDGAAR